MGKRFIILFITIFISSISFCQTTIRALFLGNSYTGLNNVPLITAGIAHSMGDSLYFDMSSPGGYTLQAHSTSNSSLNKIKQGGWDFVVLQEQSQLPSYPIDTVQLQVYPFARFLDSMINVYND